MKYMNACLNEGRESGERMRGRMRMDLQGHRLSSLSDDLIHKILSFVGIKQAIEASGLSSRWRFIWTSMPYLNFSTHDLPTLPKFSNFATNVLSHRNNLTEVHSLTLTFRVKVNRDFVKRILKYAFSHNIQQLNVVCLLHKDIEFPLSLFNSQSLKHLSLEMKILRSRTNDSYTYLTSTWELPALTTLDLHSVTLCDDETDKCVTIFSKCANLQNLKLRRFKTKGGNGFSIVHPRLSNLTLIHGCSNVKVVNVAAPQLKNLIITTYYSGPTEHVISATDLSSLIYKGFDPLRLSADVFDSIEKADICVTNPQRADAHEIVRLLQQIHSVRFLTLSLEIAEMFSSMDLTLQEPSLFVNLRSVKIYPGTLYCYRRETPKNVMSDNLKSYLLNGSPRSTFTIVFREEVKAQKIMAELGMILDKENDNTIINGGNVAPVKSSRWKNLGVQIEKAGLIVSKLQSLEELVTKLPASNRAKIQPCFSSLCAEAEIVISQITDCMKIKCDQNQSRSSVCFNEPATTSDSSS